MSKYSDLSGRGGLAASGRWHTRPKAVVYCSDEPKTTHAEILRQVGHPSVIPDAYKLMQIFVSDHVKIEEMHLSDLGLHWSDSTKGWEVCRQIGDRWFESLSSTVLKVPSAARLGSSNYLLNTVASDMGYVEITQVISQPFPENIFR